MTVDGSSGPSRFTPNRRHVLKGVGLAAGTAWMVPTVLSVSALPAAASGAFADFWSASDSETTSLIIDAIGSPPNSYLVAAVAWFENIILTPPDGWTLVANDLFPTGINLAIFVKADAPADDSITFEFAAATPSVVAFVAAYPGANSYYSDADPFADGNNTAVIAPGFTTASGATENNILYIATWGGIADPIDLDPPDLVQRGFTVGSAGPPGLSIFLADRPEPNESTAVTAATATLGSALLWIAAQIAVY